MIKDKYIAPEAAHNHQLVPSKWHRERKDAVITF